MQDARFPKNSADLYENAQKWASFYGPDFLFVTGEFLGDLVPSKDKNYSHSGNGTFRLSEKIAINPDIPATGLTPEQKARREDLFIERLNGFRRKTMTNKFPTIADVRNQENSSEGVSLLAGAAEIFVLQQQEEGPAYQWALFRRTHPATYGYLTGPNGLVSGPHAAQKEAMEELTLVDVSTPDKSVVYGLVFDDKVPNSAQTSLSIKRAQAGVLKQNLKAQGFSDSLKCETLHVSNLLPQDLGLNNNYLVLRDPFSGKYVDILYGSLGIEHNHHTVIQRVFGTVAPPQNADIRVIDGEPFNRPGNLFTPAALEVALKDGKALPLLLGIVDPVRAHWPSPAGALSRKPAAPAPNA